MARAAGAVRQLAHDLHALAAVGGGGRSGPTVPSLARTSPDLHSRGVRGLDSTSVKVHRWHGRAKKRPASHRQVARRLDHQDPSAAANERIALTFALSLRQAHATPRRTQAADALATATRWRADGDGPGLRRRPDPATGAAPRLRAGRAAQPQSPPPLGLRPHPYRRRNEIERLFRRLKGFCRIFSRFEKLDLMFTAFIHFALIIDMAVLAAR